MLSGPARLPSLYVICDEEVCRQAGWPLLDYVGACLDGGARLFQVRAKHAASGSFLDLAAAIAERTQPAGARLVVNDRADVARLAHADGVHVGQDDLTPNDVRRVVGPTAIVGLSTHSAAQIIAGLEAPVSYVAIGPVFGTNTKDTGYQPVGLELVAQGVRLAAARGVPVVGIGGMTLARAPAVLDAGAVSVAVITDLLSTGNPAGRVREYLRALSRDPRGT